MKKSPEEPPHTASGETTKTVRLLAAQGAKGFSQRLVAEPAGVAPPTDAADPIRLALARIPTRRSAPAAPVSHRTPAADLNSRKADRAAQAALGMLGNAAVRPDDVEARLGDLSEPDLQRLARLVQVAGRATPPTASATGAPVVGERHAQTAKSGPSRSGPSRSGPSRSGPARSGTAKPGSETAKSPPLLDKVEQQLAERGIGLLVKAGTVTINIGTGNIGNGTPGTGATGAGSHAAGWRSKRRPYTPYVSWARRLMRVRDFLNGH